ncbi:hypothetical protein [Prescottella agglutinans]|uniref:hypothetical protein n=1 Tax=Prescottella agglutinans TaxID=1644129 RepID=UPI003D97F4A6
MKLMEDVELAMLFVAGAGVCAADPYIPSPTTTRPSRECRDAAMTFKDVYLAVTA